MAEIRVQDEQGTIHVFPDGSTPEMIAKAMNVKPPDATPLAPAQPQPPKTDGFWHSAGAALGLTPENFQQDKQQAQGMSPLREAFSATMPHPIQVARGIAQAARSNFQKGSQEGQAALQSAQQGDIKGALAHGIGQAGFAGGTAMAPIVGDNPAKAGEQFGSGNIKGGLGTTAAMVLPFLARPALGAIGDAIPTKAKAGALFNEAATAANPVPVDVTAPGASALRIQEAAGRGGSMPKVVRDFLNRTTRPGSPPLTYEEARDFYQNASRLSANESQRLTPSQQRMVGQFARDLGNSISGAADQVGVKPQYQGAMKQYRQASNLSDTLSDAGKYLGKQALEKLPWLAAVYGGKKLYDSMQ